MATRKPAGKSGNVRPITDVHPITDPAHELDWSVLVQELAARPRDSAYHEMCDRFNAGERTRALAAAIRAPR